jgi:hypothetical protein
MGLAEGSDPLGEASDSPDEGLGNTESISDSTDHDSEPPAPKRRSRAPLLIAAAVSLVVLLALAGVAVLLSGRDDESHTIRGTFSLTDIDGWDAEGDVPHDEGDECWSEGGFDDIGVGSQIRVHDGDGTSMGTGTLYGGVVNEDYDCEFIFIIKDVGSADYYRVGSGRRGDVEYSKSEMEDNNWRVHLTL